MILIGRVVRGHDITPLARKDCGDCFGSGLFRMSTFCKASQCAMQVFHERHDGDVVEVGPKIHWIAGHEPENRDGQAPGESSQTV